MLKTQKKPEFLDLAPDADNDDLPEFTVGFQKFNDGEQHSLRELDFMDIYLCLEGNGVAHFRPQIDYTGAVDVDVPAAFGDDVEQLTNWLRHNFTGIEMGVGYDGMRLRASKLLTASGETWAAMRRIPELPPKVGDLRFVSYMTPILREIGKRDGLILLCGSTGSGKTTTASSLLLDYMENYGGVAFTIEDPVEYSLGGRRGKAGYCYQSEIDDDKQWGLMLKRSLRWHPRYIFVGEIRTPDAANQLLRAATSGHTVIATMHSGSMEEALEGLLQLAEAELGDRAPLLLAAGLTAVIYQQLTHLGVHSHFMMTEQGNPGSPIRALIRDKRIGQTRSFADQQMALLSQGGRLFSGR